MRKNLLRGAFTIFLILCLSTVAIAAIESSVKDTRTNVQKAYEEGSNEQLVESRNGTTVIISDRRFNGQMKSALTAYAPDGGVLYFNNSYSNYQDVDPVASKKSTVEYLAADRLSDDECGSSRACSRMVIERLNLTTGEVSRLYERVITARTGGLHPTAFEWHDADRIDENHYLIGDIAMDRIFVVDLQTGLVEWQWSTSMDYSYDSGHKHPNDWTHLNDVEVLPDGRYMISLRNQDQVAFLDPESGLQPNWTLGEDNNHKILYELHNPDFISSSDGGPAVISADSENNRIVEYQRENKSWTRTWTWEGDETELLWPRDADRLPNGHTLIADSNGNRVVEVNRSGDVVWSVPVSNPYEAERLGTGPESANGPSAREANLSSSTVIGSGKGSTSSVQPVKQTVDFVRSSLPAPVVNGVLFVFPVWVNPPEALAIGMALVVLAVWVVLEIRWRYTFTAGATLSVDRR